MKILTLNARNWGRDKDKSSPYYWKTRMKAMKRMLQDIDPDIICFQEMTFPATLYIPSGYRRAGLSFSHHIYVRKGIKTRGCAFTRYLNKTEVFIEQDWRLIVNVHSTWISEIHARVMNKVRDWVNGSQVWYSDCIVCGDFNNPPVPDDELSLIETNPPGVGTFRKFDKDAEARIDFFMSGSPLGCEKAFVIRNGYGAERISDHYPVLLVVPELTVTR